MKPVSVSIEVDQSPDEVFAFLDVMANHERFTDHFMQQWRCEGPATGVGARAHVVSVLGGRREPVDLAVIDADPPHLTVERNVSADGKRVAEGSYELSSLAEGRTRVTFTYAWIDAPLGDRLLAPVARLMLRRAARTALERLCRELHHERVAHAVAASPSSG